MRIIGFILVFTLGICNLVSQTSVNTEPRYNSCEQTTDRRLPPKPRQGPFINLRAFKSPAYTFYSLSAFMNFLGLYTVSPLCLHSRPDPLTIPLSGPNVH